MPKSLQAQLEECRLLIYGVSDNEAIKTRIAAIYPEERIAQGISLFNSTKLAFEKQETEKIESTEATRVFNKTYDSIYTNIVQIRKAGRYFFKNNTELSTLLRLNKEVPTRYADWKTLADATINTVTSHLEIQEKLTLVEITPEVINECKTMLANIAVKDRC